MLYEKGVGDNNDRTCSVQTIGEECTTTHTASRIKAHQLMYLCVRHCDHLLRETKIKKHSTRQQEILHRRQPTVQGKVVAASKMKRRV